jgi:hypothetical protein
VLATQLAAIVLNYQMFAISKKVGHMVYTTGSFDSFMATFTEWHLRQSHSKQGCNESVN